MIEGRTDCLFGGKQKSRACELKKSTYLAIIKRSHTVTSRVSSPPSFFAPQHGDRRRQRRWQRRGHTKFWIGSEPIGSPRNTYGSNPTLSNYSRLRRRGSKGRVTYTHAKVAAPSAACTPAYRRLWPPTTAPGRGRAASGPYHDPRDGLGRPDRAAARPAAI